jgi:hypothetical protein
MFLKDTVGDDVEVLASEENEREEIWIGTWRSLTRAYRFREKEPVAKHRRWRTATLSQ